MADNERVDVLIVGAGASGAAVAWSLADTRMRILCLEQGDWIRSADFPSNGRDWEARRYTDFDISPNRRGRDTDYPVNDDSSPMKIANFNGVGGGTVIYTAHWPRMHPSDFRVKSLDGVADDWPVDYWALEPFYIVIHGARRHAMLIGGDLADSAARAQLYPGADGERPVGNVGACLGALCATRRAVAEVDALCTAFVSGGGDSGVGGPPVPAQPVHRPRIVGAGLAQRDRRHGRIARRHTWVTRETGSAHHAVVLVDAEGREHFQPAEVVIVACNGVGTPRLLLNSASARFPSGLANSSGLVGRNLMLHPWPMIFGYVEEALDGGRGPITCLWSKQFYETDPSRGFVRGYTLQFGRGTGPANQAIVSAAAGHLPWGREHHRRYRELLDHRVNIGVACEDLPEEHNRVTLDPVLKDSHGIPAPRIDYAISENTRRMMEHGIARAEEILAAAGATQVHASRSALNSPGHLLGTARMGDDPERSVVNAWGRCHDVKNLFIVDGSIWVTSGGVNPTSTIQALALYIADQMKQRLATLFD
jgi:choline dehydrogenase-like flavoprotein